MGGRLTVAFRFPEGEVQAWNLHTNPMKFWLMHPKALRGDRAYIARYLAEQEKEAPKPAPLAPNYYGLVVLDFVSNHFFSMQEYTTFGTLHPAQVTMSLDTPLAREKIDLWLTERRISEEHYEDEAWRVRPLNSAVRDADSFVTHCGDMASRYAMRFDVPPMALRVDLSPLRLIDFRHTLRGCNAFLSQLDALGFLLTAKDREVWQDWADEHADDCDDR